MTLTLNPKPLTLTLLKMQARYINQLLHSQFLMIFTFLLEWWSSVKIVIYADLDIIHTMASENSVCIPNHPGKLDWLVGVAIACRAGQLGCTRVLLKKDLLYVPIVGWTFYFTEMIFLNRDW
jgi:lysophosphatidic acid acyltransferase/lysophosphatidylinositol acyltransferase